MNVNSPKKVLHIVGRSSYDGTCIFALRLAEALSDFDHFFLFVQEGSASTELGSLRKKYLSGSKKRNVFSYMGAVVFFFLGNNYDVIHYHSGGRIILLFSYLFKKKAKYIHHFHCGNLTCKPDSTYPDIFDIFLFRFLKMSSIQVAVSKRVMESYVKYVGRSNNIVCIPNSVSFEFRKKEKVNYTVGYIGQISKLKNFDSLINCIEAIANKYPQMKFLIKGDNYTGNIIKELNVEYIPPSLDISTFYENVDVILFPSIASEGMPLVILEAISFDTPVISMKIHAVKDLLGDYPLYVNNYTPEELVEKINLFYDQADRGNLSQVHKNISSEYKFSETIKNIAAIYNKTGE